MNGCVLDESDCWGRKEEWLSLNKQVDIGERVSRQYVVIDT